MKHFLRRILFYLCWPGLYLYFHGSHRARVILVADDAVLLVQDRFTLWFDEGVWSVPGGGMHASEPARSAAVRELQEELGVVTKAHVLKPLWDGMIRSSGLSYHAHYFFLEIDRSTPLTLQRSELRQAIWFSQQSLPQALKREARKAVELLAELS